MNPKILKATYLLGHRLNFRNASIKDAEFILSLRTDKKKSEHLSQTTNDLDMQVDWLKRYELAVDQAYFIIEDKFGVSLGTVRLYDQVEQSFCWGSWILKEGAPQSAAIESALMVYSYAIDHLGFHAAHFDVRKANENVCRFHERFGAKRMEETEIDFLYQINANEILAARSKYQKFLPESVKITGIL